MVVFDLNIAPETFTRYVDNSHARFITSEQSLEFLTTLNKQDISMQYTTEFENENKQLNFLQFQYLLESINKKRKNKTSL